MQHSTNLMIMLNIILFHAVLVFTTITFFYISIYTGLFPVEIDYSNANILGSILS